MYKVVSSKDRLNRDLWIEVDLAAIAHNMRLLRRATAARQITAVIKADGYGHGAVEIGRTLLENGADRFAVATADEAYELREHFPDVPILVLSDVAPEIAPALAKSGISVVVTSADKLERFSDYMKSGAASGAASDAASEAASGAAGGESPRLAVHIAVDTGMGRIGAEPTDEVARAFAEASKHEGIRIEGLISHFATADDYDDKDFSVARAQADRFIEFAAALKAHGVEPEIKHISNSAAIMNLPEYHMDMVRAGILMFGMTPTGRPWDPSKALSYAKEHASAEVLKKIERAEAKERESLSAAGSQGSRKCIENELCPALSIKAKVIFVKQLSKDMGISYGHTYRAKAGAHIATIPAGYADGISRLLSNKIDLIINGKRFRQVGNICMDHLMAEVDASVKVGDEAVIAGFQGSEHISIEEIAEKMGTLNYEIICMLSKRIPRVYL